MAQQLGNAKEARFVVLNHAAVGRNRHLAVGEGVERVDGLIGRNSRLQINHNLDFGGSVVVHLLDFYLAFFIGFQYGIDERCRAFSVRHVLNHQRFVIDFLDASAHSHSTATLTVVVARNVDETARREVGIKFERLALKVENARIDKFVEVVRQNFRCQTNGNALNALRKQQREFDRKRHWLAVAAVV